MSFKVDPIHPLIAVNHYEIFYVIIKGYTLTVKGKPLMGLIIKTTILLLMPLSLFSVEFDDPVILSLGAIVIILLLALTALFLRHRSQGARYQAKIDKVAQEAQEAERAKDTFLANVSHETRTPMTAIIGLSHVLLQGDLDHAQKMNVTKIKRSAEHLLAITNDILDYSKIEAGKLEINSNSFETPHLLNDLADMMGVQAVEKGLDLIFDISPKLPQTLMGDSLRISQVLINLLNNAIKFTDFGEIILRIRVVEAHQRDYTIRFEVQDSGIGLTMEQQSRLFQAFDQADNKISRKYGGSGLGLAISQELVEKMGGRLEVKSTFREGSSFFFTLTLEAPETPLVASNQHMQRILHNKSILILESNSFSATLLANTLAHYRAQPKIISRIDEMYRLLRDMVYDAIFIDSRFLPSITESLLINRQSERIILLNYEVHGEHSVTNLRIDATVTKPFIYQSILHTMKELFDKEITINRVGMGETTLEDILILKGSRVLLAEDNEGNKMVVEGLLQGSGIELTTVTNGQKAVEAILEAEKPYELIIMDINMPVMDGYVATSIIREYQKFDNIPIIAMTANITESDIEKSKDFGMQAHLSKPIDVSDFYQTLLKFIPPKANQQERKEILDNQVNRQVLESLTTLPCIDIKDGLSRLNGNSRAYLDVLYKFAEMFADVKSEFQRLIEKKEYSTARALAHNLKGLSGNIGAKEIYTLAQELEDAFKDEEGEFEALVNAIEHKREPLTHAIITLQQLSGKESKEERPAISTQQAETLLHELSLHARKKKALEVKKSCQQIVQYQWPQEEREKIEKLLRHAKSYQFKEVCDIIESFSDPRPEREVDHV